MVILIMSVLTAHMLSKRFGNTVALDELSITFTEGISALIGPNGAGKTTFINICSGLVARDSGDLTVLSFDPWTDGYKLRKKLSILIEDLRFPATIPASKILKYYSRILGIRDYEERIMNLAEYFEIRHALNIPVSKYSAGMLKRFALVYTFLNPDAELVILDEPSANLDVAGRLKLFDYIERLNKEEGVSIIISSHILPDLIEICDYYHFIHRGRVYWSGDLNSLNALVKTKSFRLRTSNDELVLTSLLENGYRVEYSSRGIIVSDASPNDLLRIIAEISTSQDVEVYEFRRYPDPLTHLFREMIYGE